MSTVPILSVRGLTKRFGETEVLKGIDLEVQTGEVVCIIGPSGSGKSTLLRCLNLLETAEGGEIHFHGERIDQLGHDQGRAAERMQNRVRARIGMVFQQFNLWPWHSVITNVIEAPMLVRGLSRDAAEAEARELLEKVGLSHKASERPSNLSGGQQQRVAIARALAMHPDVMLFDEATSALDPALKEEVLTVMRDLAAEGMTMICVTHEMNFAASVADRVAFVDHGIIVEIGTPAALFREPRDERTRQFMRSAIGELSR